MSTAEIATLEHAGRSAMAYSPEVLEQESRLGLLVQALTPALGILAVAAALLFVIA